MSAGSLPFELFDEAEHLVGAGDRRDPLDAAVARGYREADSGPLIANVPEFNF